MKAGLWLGPEPLVLASGSAARRSLLVSAGLDPEIEVSGIDERGIEAGLAPIPAPAELAARLARAKALAVAARRPDALVIGADQVLSCAGEVFAKPPDAAAAEAQIARLAGRTHELHSACAIVLGGEIVAAFADEARLTMRALARDAIARYVAAAGPAATRCVGGYEFEGLGIHLFEKVMGAQATILGLPLLPLLADLRRLGRLRL